MFRRISTAALLFIAAAMPASAATYSFSGTFTYDDDVQMFTFSIGAASEVTLISYGYAGGTQTDGSIVSAGGFDPVMALFDGTGAFVTYVDDGDGVAIDPVTGVGYDVSLTTTLAAGDYSVALMQFNNEPIGDLSAGFTRAGQRDFTTIVECGAPYFCDDTVAIRNGEWAFDILNVDTALIGGSSVIPLPTPVPLPAAAPLMFAGIAALGLLRRRKG